MPTSAKRKPDLRCIRTSKVYTIAQITECLDRSRDTIRRWTHEGLPVLDNRLPVLIDGKQLKEWLQERYRQRKRRCGPGQFFCCRCREPRDPAEGSLEQKIQNQKTIMLKAVCSVCSTVMHKAGARTGVDHASKEDAAGTTGKPHLSCSENPGGEPAKAPDSRTNRKSPGKQTQLALDLFSPGVVGKRRKVS